MGQLARWVSVATPWLKTRGLSPRTPLQKSAIITRQSSIHPLGDPLCVSGCLKVAKYGGLSPGTPLRVSENNVDRTHVSRILQLTSQSPTIVEQILEGKEPEGMSLRQLRKGIPLLWSEQGKIAEA
jgi:hypothetical protein